MKTGTTDRFLEHEAGAAHELLPHLLPAAIGKVVPRNDEPFSVGDVVTDLVHLAVDRPPLRLLVAGLPFPPRRRSRHPSRRTEVAEEDRQPPPEPRRPPRRCQHRQRQCWPGLRRRVEMGFFYELDLSSERVGPKRGPFSFKKKKPISRNGKANGGRGEFWLQVGQVGPLNGRVKFYSALEFESN